MADEDAQPLGAGDGSIDDAVLNMPDSVFDQLDEPTAQPPQQQRRVTRELPPNVINANEADQDGQEAEYGDAEIVEEVAARSNSSKQVTEADVADESELENEFFEFAPLEDGGDPRRVPASEVLAGYEEREQMRQRIAEIEEASIPPEEYDNAIMEAVNTRGQLIRKFQELEALFAPADPDTALLDENSPNYNPSLFNQQLAFARQRSQQVAQWAAEREAMEVEQEQQEQALQAAMIRRETHKLQQFWPELKDEKVSRQVRNDLIKHYGKYGVSNELINGVYNSAFYALAKDALAYRNAQTKKGQAVKVVRTKPKLVKGQARNSDTARRSAAGMQRLRQSGSLDHAADALEGLI